MKRKLDSDVFETPAKKSNLVLRSNDLSAKKSSIQKRKVDGSGKRKSVTFEPKLDETDASTSRVEKKGKTTVNKLKTAKRFPKKLGNKNISNRGKANANFKPSSTGNKQMFLTKKQKRERKLQFKSKKNNFELVTEAKKLWEIVRNNANKQKRDELTQQLHNLIKGKVKELIYAHDTSRVIECLMAIGNQTIKNALYDELKGDIVNLCQSKYAKFFVMKVLAYGSKEQQGEIISCFKGHVVKLMKHTEAASVVEKAYNEYAKAAQRDFIIGEFFGSTYALYKTDENASLATIMEDDIKRKSVLNFMKKTLTGVANKSVLRHSLFHKVFFEYFKYCTEEDRSEMIQMIKESVVQILHTRDGSRVGMICVWHGTAKDRKTIIKSMKTHVVKICQEKQGYLVLLAIFDCVDDTKLVQKSIIEEVLQNLNEIILDPTGRKVILYLLKPRDKVYFHPDVIRILAQGDCNKISKKDRETRQTELRASVSNGLIEHLVENARELMFNSSSNIVCQAILKHSIGDRTRAFEAIAQVVAEPFNVKDKNSVHIVDTAAGHLFLKHLLAIDKENFVSSPAEPLLCKYLLKAVPQENYRKWIKCNRGAFTLKFMVDTGVEVVVRKLKEILEPLHGKLEESSFSGTKFLLEKLNSL